MAGILLNRSRQAPAEETPAFGGIAERFRRAGDLDRAIALCRDGLKRFPDQLSARVTLGWALLDKGQYDEARAELERVIRKAPDNLAAIRGLAELHDRSEGAMPGEESWHPEEAVAPAASAAPASAAAVPPSPVSSDASAPAALAVQPKVPVAAAPVSAAPQDDPFAPIAVALPVSGAAGTPELLHTAQQAERAAEEAAAGYDLPGGSLDKVTPVELEHPAAASMAAAGAADAPTGESIQFVDPAAAALVAAADNLDLTIEAEPTAIEFSAADAMEAVPLAFAPATDESFSQTVETSSSELLEGLAVTFDGAELDDAIRALSVDTGPAIDFGSATGTGVDEADPEVAAATAALEAISFDDVSAEVLPGEHEAAAASAAEGVLAQWMRTSKDQPAINFGVASEELAGTSPALLGEGSPAPTEDTFPVETAPSALSALAEPEASGEADLQPPDQIWSDDVLAPATDPAGAGAAAGPITLPDAPDGWFLEPEAEDPAELESHAFPTPQLATLESATPDWQPSDFATLDASAFTDVETTGRSEDVILTAEAVPVESLQGPPFELVAPEPAAWADIEDESAGPDYEVATLKDSDTPDLFEILLAQPESMAPDTAAEVGLDISAAAASEAEAPSYGRAADLQAAAPEPIEVDPTDASDSSVVLEVASAQFTTEALAESEPVVDVLESWPSRAVTVSFGRPAVEPMAAVVRADVVDRPLAGPPVFGLASRTGRSQASLVALERLLRKVEARRLQLQAESVA